MKTKTAAAKSLALAAAIVLMPLSGAAATLTVDCGAGEKIQDKVVVAKPRDVIQVSGTCAENVRIPPDVVSVTLDGQGKAQIHAPGRGDSIYIRGREITVRGFALLTGGRDGIHLSGGGSGASAVIERNTIRKTGRHGIHLDHNSVGRISQNVIEDVSGIGIEVNESAVARIGYITNTTGGSGNTIRGAGSHGIAVARGSSARILDNTITNSKGSGIYVHRGSQADIFGNDISGNGENGITVRYGSGVNLAIESVPSSLKPGPNRTDAGAKNAGVGVSCSVSGYADGPIGSLDGARGTKELDGTCVDRLK